MVPQARGGAFELLRPRSGLVAPLDLTTNLPLVQSPDPAALFQIDGRTEEAVKNEIGCAGATALNIA